MQKATNTKYPGRPTGSLQLESRYPPRKDIPIVGRIRTPSNICTTAIITRTNIRTWKRKRNVAIIRRHQLDHGWKIEDNGTNKDGATSAITASKQITFRRKTTLLSRNISRWIEPLRMNRMRASQCGNEPWMVQPSNSGNDHKIRNSNQQLQSGVRRNEIC